MRKGKSGEGGEGMKGVRYGRGGGEGVYYRGKFNPDESSKNGNKLMIT